MKIRLNGAERETAALTLGALVAELALPPRAVLVEQNGEAHPRDTWEGAALREGDRIELLRIAAGG